jgi:uncharacterized metal-binding protein
VTTSAIKCTVTVTQVKDGHRLELEKRMSTDTEGIARCLGLQSEAKIDLEVIVELIEKKITVLTLFSLNQAPPPTAVNPQE